MKSFRDILFDLRWHRRYRAIRTLCTGNGRRNRHPRSHREAIESLEITLLAHVLKMRAKGWRLSGRVLADGELEYVRIH